jgi:hypothetical protein
MTTLKELVTRKNLRTVIPKQVPTDIVNCVGNYLYPEIQTEAEKLYDVLVHKIINPVYVPKEIFVERMIHLFVEHIGYSYTDFRQKFHDILDDTEAAKQYAVQKIIDPFYMDLNPCGVAGWSEGTSTFIFEEILKFFDSTVKQLGINEGVVFKDVK